MEAVGHCRVCYSTDLKFLFSIGSQYVNDFVESGQERAGIQYPLELELCRNCTLVQLRHTAPQEILYSRHYWYRSGVTSTMRAALHDVIQAAMPLVQLERRDVFLDIGSNDGTLLRLCPTWLKKVGVEPANNLAEEGKRGLDVFIHDFWNSAAYWQHVGEPAKVITALGMFYDLDDPNQFIADVSDVLHEDGIFVAQLMCLRQMLNQGDVGNLAHEHLEFYSLASLSYLLERHGLKIVDIQENTVNGGSYRLFIRKLQSTAANYPGASHRVAKAFEYEAYYCDPAFYEAFYQRIEYNKQQVVNFIQEVHRQGKKTWVYGASTKGNVILQYYGLDRTLIDGAAERSPEKWGKRTVGSGISIFSEEDARAANPDYFLVLPYAFLDEFIRRESDWRARGGRFIVPLPELRIV